MERNLSMARVKSHAALMQKYKEIYDMYYVKNMSQKEISAKTGYSRAQVYYIFSKFASENPQKAEEMRNSKKTFTQEDYLKLQAELESTREQLKRQSRETAIYKELVAIGKEVYGIDLKKAGTKQ